MKRFLLSMALLAALAMPALAQQQAVVLPQQASPLHEVLGTFYAPAYATWRGTIISGNASTGSGQSIIVAGSNSGGIVLQDGTTLPMTTVFNTNVPIFIQDESNSGNSETVTPSAVSVGVCPGGNVGVGSGTQCATITGTFNYSHGASAFVVSGDAGIEEAIADAANQGGGDVFWVVDTGNVSLTGGATTTASAKVPSTFFIGGASAYVETTITTSTSWEVGVSGAASAFCANNTVLTAGTTCKAASVATVGTGSTALEGILITNSTTPGAGVLKVRAWGDTPVQSAF